jgi:hypothetical protein
VNYTIKFADEFGNEFIQSSSNIHKSVIDIFNDQCDVIEVQLDSGEFDVHYSENRKQGDL